ncbi:MAG TPA: alpha/beta hydrolase [Thermoleophilaceae bacterium]
MGVVRPRRATPAVVVLLALAACMGAAASGAAAAARPDARVHEQRNGARQALRLRLGGGERRSAKVCGRTRKLTQVGRGGKVRAVAAAAGQSGKSKLRLVVRRCLPAAGRLGPARLLGRRTVGARPERFKRRVPAVAAGDYAVELRLARRGRRRLRRVAYLRVTETAAPEQPGGVADIPVRFAVKNQNGSALPCQSDGADYTVAGRLVAPRSLLRASSRAAVLHLHEFGFGRFFWQFPSETYDYAHHQALAGHASVVLDRLGYDESSHPPGDGTCVGSQADIAHQIVLQLRAGSYSTVGDQPVSFKRIALAGHSGGGAISELEAYSFGDIDALILFAYADSNFTNPSIQAANDQGFRCLTSPEEAEPGGPGGYAYFGSSPEEWRGFMFTSAEPAVAAAAAALRNRDPCGDTNSFTPTVVSNNQHGGEIRVPALLLYGTSDAIYQQPQAGEAQRDLLSGSPDVTLHFFEGTGHALTLERSAPQMRAVVSNWLGRHGL